MYPKYKPEESLKYIYKYRAINEYTINSIINNELYFSSPMNFNDPFDSIVNIHTDSNNHEILAYLASIQADENLKKKAIENVQSNRYEIPKNFLYKLNTALICSFSSINNNILMWSHYSSNHTGICLEFELLNRHGTLGFEIDDIDVIISKVSQNFIPIMKVAYSEEMPQSYNPVSDDRIRIFDFAITKHLDWRYEKEYRLLLVKKLHCNKNLIKFNKKRLKSVIWGLNISKENKLGIKQIINENYNRLGFKVDFFKSEYVLGKYAICITPDN